MKALQNKLLLAISVVVCCLTAWSFSSKKLTEPLRSPITPVPQDQEASPTPAAANQAAASPQSSPSTSYEKQVLGYMAAFSAPINFYGKVVDQHGDPVTDAMVKLYANDKPINGAPSEYSLKTDVAGRFALKGAAGITLGVEVSKVGYLIVPSSYGKVTSSGLFEYGLSSRGLHQSSTDAPTVFTLHKQGTIASLVKIGEKSFRLARDGSPLSIAVDEQDAHQVVLRCWNQELNRPAGQRQYDWKLEISVPNGGLLARKDAFAFEAPQDGYAPTEIIEMSVSLGHQWRSLVERSYFMRFADGTYARAYLEMHSGGDHFVVWESFFNPKVGSRNLESSPEGQSASR